MCFLFKNDQKGENYEEKKEIFGSDGSYYAADRRDAAGTRGGMVD